MPLMLLSGGECELKAVGAESAGGGQELALKSGPFESSDEALAAGQQVTAGLLLSSLRQGYAVSINVRVPCPPGSEPRCLACPSGCRCRRRGTVLWRKEVRSP
jgi:hypothetical protein